MYPVSSEYQSKIKQNNRTFKTTVQIQHSTGVLNLTDKDIVGGSMLFTEGSQAGEEFTIGGTVASDFSIDILNKEEYKNINFDGATIIPTVAILLSETIDTENYFLSAPQPTEFEEGVGVETWEYVPLGRFNIDDVNRQRNSIKLKAIDNMINLDKPYSLSSLSYPATLYQIYVNICNVADVTIATLDFPNKDYLVEKMPDGDLSFRDMLGYVAEMSGTFGKFNRLGALELKWYTDANLSLGPANRFDFINRDDLVKINGIMATVDDTTYLAGVEDFAIDLTENPLLQGDYATVLPNIFNNVKDTIFTPFESSWQGDPSVQAGDILTQTDRDGKVFNTLVTNSTYKYRGASTLSAKGLPLIAKGYKGSTNRKIAEIKRKIDKDVGDKLTTLEQAQLDATELIANMLGGYTHFEADAFYISDNPVLALSTKIWKWGIGGFGYSYNGGETYTAGITADGSIVANLVAAGIITADMVQTGLLQSEDASTWINLDNGEFNFKNALKWVGGELIITSPSISDSSGSKVFNTQPTTPYKIGDLWRVTNIAGVDFKICTIARASGVYVAGDWVNADKNKGYTDDIKNLISTISGGTTTIDSTKVRVNHASGQYSEMNANGFVRQWQYGQAKYLNDIYAYATYSSGAVYYSPPTSVRVRLPESFQGRGSQVQMILSISSIYSNNVGVDSTGYVYMVEGHVETVLEIESTNFNITRPEIYVKAYTWASARDEDDWRYSRAYDLYRKLGFTLLVLGE